MCIKLKKIKTHEINNKSFKIKLFLIPHFQNPEANIIPGTQMSWKL